MKRAACLLSAVLVLVPAVANAACNNSWFSGQWAMYISRANGDWLRCFLTINGTAVANTTCRDSDNISRPLTNGTISIIAPVQCTFRMTFSISGTANVVRFMTPNINNDVTAGVGAAAGENFSMMMTRRAFVAP